MTDPADTAEAEVAPRGAGEADEASDTSLPAPSAAAHALFGDQLDRAARYAELLATSGIAHGHLGPRELTRIWDRHLANSAVVTDLLPVGAAVIDVGSGAGLPGVAMAVRRPDLQVVLVEPMLRRTTFLERVVGELELAHRVIVVRGRAEDAAVQVAVGGASWVTARAVAPLERLAGWCLPLLVAGGQLLALKGSTAADEVSEFEATAPRALRASVASLEVLELGREYAMDTTQVIRVQRSAHGVARRRRP